MHSLVDLERLLLKSEIIDTRYPSRGAVIWLPYGMRILSLYVEEARKLFSKAEFEEYRFPAFASAGEFALITNEIKDFSKRVFWIDEHTLLTPSGESTIYPMFRLWIKSYKDLPIRAYQVGSMFRNGIGRGVLRSSETTPFIEGHTAHATSEDARLQLEQNIRLIENLHDFLGVPLIVTERPVWTNNPVSETTIGFDTWLPIGETLLTSAAYDQQQVFSSIFDIKFSTAGNQLAHTYQTSLGFSYRVLFVSLLLYADERGLRLLPEIAPYHVVIFPIYSRASEHIVLATAERMKEKLVEKNVRVLIDATDSRLGEKHYKWESKGVPLRVEIGASEIKADTVTAIHRYDGKRAIYSQNAFVLGINELLEDQAQELKKSIKSNHEQNIVSVYRTEDINGILSSGQIGKLDLCRNKECLAQVEAVSRGEVLGFQKIDYSASCLVCGSNVLTLAFIARRV